MADWHRRVADGLVLSIRLTPRGGRDRIEGVRTLSDGSGVLAARVAAAPEKGAANTALERLIARALGVAPTTVAVASGHKARRKTVHVAGDPRTLSKRLASLAKGLEGDDA